MKLKEIPRTATFAWSPDASSPTVVTGTAAGTIDANFSAATELELWKLDLLDHSIASFTAAPAAHVETDSRFHDIAISGDGQFVVGALESGVVEAWSLPGLRSVARNDSAHTGAVKSVSFSSKEPTKFATGGSQGEVFIWNIQDLSSPFTPGTAAAQRHDDVESVSWNSSAAHILASGGNKGFASIWDTRRRREVLHLHYDSPTSGLRVPISSVQWHPSNSTKLATASMDDNEPVICIWDLKNVNSPERVLRGHSKGVLSIDWCHHDENLLISGGRDNATLLWNPQSGEQLGAYPISVEWAFKASFHPRMPDLFASASFDGKISVQTLQDTASSESTQGKASNTAADGADFWESDTVMDSVHPSFRLQQPPKWLVRPISATFGFGGKLVVTKGKTVDVQQVADSALNKDVTEQLGTALKTQDFSGFAKAKDAKTGWPLLSALLDGKSVPIPELDTLADSVKEDELEDEFDIVPPFAPSSNFELLGSKHNSVVAAVLAKNFDSAVSQLISRGEAGDALLIASLGGPDLVKRAQNAYLNAHAATEPYLRAAWSMATSNPMDLVENSELKAWPAVLRAVIASDNSANATYKLGKRLVDSGDRENALVVYLAGSNVGAAAALWLDELPQTEKELANSGNCTPYVAHVRALQGVVEKLVAATSKLGLPKITDPGADKLYSAFRDYADVVAQQGELALAKHFLDMLPDQYAADKQRVNVATEQKSQRSRRSNAPSSANYTAPTMPSMAAPAHSVTSRSVPAPSPQTNSSQAASFLEDSPAKAGVRRQVPSRASGAPNRYAANPYAPSGAGSAASPAAMSVAASAAAAAAVPPPPPTSADVTGTPSTYPTVPFKGWNDIPELPGSARRKPAAPTRVAATQPAATAAPPSASSSPRGSISVAPPPTAAASAAPPPRIANPYAPNSASGPSSRAVSASKPNPYAPPPSSTPTSSISAPPRPGSRSAAPPPRARMSSSSSPVSVAPPPPFAPPPKAAAPPVAAAPPAATPPVAVPPPVAAPPPVATPPMASSPAVAPPTNKLAGFSLDSELSKIQTGLDSELNRVRPVIEAQYAKQYNDTARRLSMLYNKLNSLSEGVAAELVTLAESLVARDYEVANAKLQSIASDYADETGEWFTGVKRLVKMSAGVPV